jgi:F-type H+-transporting ATPase subunit a
MSNIIGLLPYIFTITSQLANTLSLSLLLFGFINLLIIYQAQIHTLEIALMPGIPFLLIPLIS